VSVPIPKETRLVLPALTDSAEGEPCTFLIENVCDGGGPTSVWCHSNMSRHGRGLHRKADDCFGAIGCAKCHYWYDFGNTATRAEKEEAFMRAFERSLRYLWFTGRLRIK
jgi:hypothetical protein